MDSSEIGHRFHPTDEELVNHYLRLKMLGNDNLVSGIPELNILNYEPWDLPENSVRRVSSNSNEETCYFFCPRVYSNGNRVDRRSTTGYWKPTGKDRKIKDIGLKRILVFYQSPANRMTRTNWIIHEYSPTFNFPTQRDFVLCKLKRMADADNDMPPQEEVEQLIATDDAEAPNSSATTSVESASL